MASFKREVKGAYTKESKYKRKLCKQGLDAYQDLKVKAPDWLSDLATEIFYSTVEASKKENFKELDIPVLATFSATYANIIVANQHLQEEGLVVDGKKNPYERIQNEMTVQLQKLAKELGITPNSRARIEMNRAKNHEDTSKDPFLKVVNSNG